MSHQGEETLSGNMLPNVLPNLEDLRIPIWTSDKPGLETTVADPASG